MLEWRRCRSRGSPKHNASPAGRRLLREHLGCRSLFYVRHAVDGTGRSGLSGILSADKGLPGKMIAIKSPGKLPRLTVVRKYVRPGDEFTRRRYQKRPWRRRSGNAFLPRRAKRSIPRYNAGRPVKRRASDCAPGTGVIERPLLFRQAVGRTTHGTLSSACQKVLN
jgi:hypothetical protein